MTDRIRWKIASYIMPEWMLLTITKALIKVLKDAEQ